VISEENVSKVLEILKDYVKRFQIPAVGRISLTDPFRILISTVISARTKDRVTVDAAKRLFEVVKTPQDLIKLGEEQVAKLIYPAGFYHTKAKNLINIALELVNRFSGKVPDNLHDLLSLKGVGRKTANLVLGLGFNKDAICVDTHVHRIVNRWGFVSTKTPRETELKLMQKLPRKHWKEINEILVAFGQHVCVPISPYCSKCPITMLCPKIGVKKTR